MIQSDLHAQTRGEIIETGLAQAEEDLFLVNPTRETMQEFVQVYREVDAAPRVALFADSAPLKELVGDFLIASTLADLLAEDTVSVRTLESVPRHSLLLTEEFLISLVENGEEVGGLTTSEEPFVRSTYSHYETRWEEASSFSLRTPPLSHIRGTLRDEIGPETASDFDRVLDLLDTARGDGDGFDEVTIALLVAANNGELLYDISRWGEDIRLASKATFSRSKNQLEESGLIDTEKVPIDVGRPRLRLMLGDEELRRADIEEVAEHARAVLD
ncbi:hypothetical protein BRC61_01920 [Halobacteriales archaeon QH_10_65_19]|nr:MAG: hypothetical protein BRC61_01920 [Halobacteriales archaeon QH_10_65_19]